MTLAGPARLEFNPAPWQGLRYTLTLRFGHVGRDVEIDLDSITNPSELCLAVQQALCCGWRPVIPSRHGCAIATNRYGVGMSIKVVDVHEHDARILGIHCGLVCLGTGEYWDSAHVTDAEHRLMRKLDES